MSSKLLTIEESNLCSEFTVDIIKSTLANNFKYKLEDFDIKFKINKKTDFKYLVSCIESELTSFNFNVHNFDGENILFTKIINDIDITKLDIFPTMRFYKENYKKIVALLSAYFETVDIILLADCSFSRYIGKNYFLDLNKDFKPNFKINNYVVRIIGNNPLYIKDVIARFTENFKYIEFKNQIDDDFIKEIFHYYNEFVISSEYGIKLNNEQELENLESNLNLIKMLMI